jgi:hypothetical protein
MLRSIQLVFNRFRICETHHGVFIVTPLHGTKFTILYFGARQKLNHLETKLISRSKIKEGITIQPLGSFSTIYGHESQNVSSSILHRSKGREADTLSVSLVAARRRAALVPNSKPSGRESRVQMLSGRLRRGHGAKTAPRDSGSCKTFDR